jgi:hypothetical protein
MVIGHHQVVIRHATGMVFLADSQLAPTADLATLIWVHLHGVLFGFMRPGVLFGFMQPH